MPSQSELRQPCRVCSFANKFLLYILFRYFMHKKAWHKRKEVAGINDRQQYVLKRINSVD